MTPKDNKTTWNSDVAIPSGQPTGGFTINTGVEVNQINNEPVSPREVKKEIKVTDRDIGVLFPSLLFKSRVDDKEFLDKVKEKVLAATKDKEAGTIAGDPKDPVGWYSFDDLHQREGFEDVHDLSLIHI